MNECNCSGPRKFRLCGSLGGETYMRLETVVNIVHCNLLLLLSLFILDVLLYLCLMIGNLEDMFLETFHECIA